MLKFVCISLFVISGCASKTVDRNLVKKQVQDKRYEAMNCYKEQFKKDSELSGKLLLKWQINDKGQAQNIQAFDSTITNIDLIDCVKGIISQMQFAEAPEGKTVEIRYPWIFSTDSLR